MTQAIDPIKLKAAAERLEWVLKQYPQSDDVQSLLYWLTPLIEDAKAEKIKETTDMMDVPGAWNFSDGRYIPYQSPSVDEAYCEFVAEMRGGRSPEEKQLIARMEAFRKKMEGSRP